MKKRFLTYLLCASVLGLVSGSVQAEDAAPKAFEFSGNVGFVSEYSFRGIAQSDERPALQGGFDVNHSSGLYAGVWGSNVDFNDGDQATVETDFYAGYSNSFKGLTYDLGALYYAYPGADDDLDYDYMELAFSLGYDFEVASLEGSVNYSPENFADSGHAWYFASALEVPLPRDFSLNAHIGYQTIDDATAFGVNDYTDWSLGVGYAIQGFDLGLQYVDTDLPHDQCEDGCDERVILSVSRSF